MKMDDNIIHILIGRSEEDLNHIDTLWWTHTGSSLASTIDSLTSNKILRNALKITKVADQALLFRDANRLEELFGKTFLTRASGNYPAVDSMMDMLLRHSNPFIQQLALYFLMATGSNLDKTIGKSRLDDVTKEIGVHAVRTAKDPTYGDITLLKHVWSKSGREVDVAIWICRVHRSAVHWAQIQDAWSGSRRWSLRIRFRRHRRAFLGS